LNSWVVLELTVRGDKENPEEVRAAIQKSLSGCEVYIPAIETQVGDDSIVHYLVKGYAFARYDREDKQYFRLENTKYVNTVLTTPGKERRKVAPVEHSYIETMQDKIRAEVNQGIGVGDTVRICTGPYKNITAQVITEIPEERQVQVFVQLRSKEAILLLPRSGLEVIDRAPLSPYFARLGYLRAWAQMAKVVLAYSTPHERLLDLYRKYCMVEAWQVRGRRLYSYIYASSLVGQHEELLQRRELLVQVEDWFSRGRRLSSFIFSDQLIPEDRLEVIEAKRSELERVLKIEHRLQKLSQEVEDIGRSLVRKKKEGVMTVQNVLVDGFNLAFRCFYAPGMDSLIDSQGRPTGVLFGFLKSLGALKKRFPEAKFWVAWDGSSQRRKSQYPDYKGNRKATKSETTFDQIDALRKVLPSLGVRQVWNPEEEADDVIGTMVRGDLKDQDNLIFSTDRDFMQLVNAKTRVLFPAVGSRKEVVYDIEAVEKNMGVPPEKIVDLRAFYGDSSDNLPGVPRVPKKVLQSLIQAHGSVKGVYASGLSGLTKIQYDRLRSAEPQVRINLDLMSLVDVDVSRIDPDVDVKSATEVLQGLEIKPEPIIEAFFGKASESVPEAVA